MNLWDTDTPNDAQLEMLALFDKAQERQAAEKERQRRRAPDANPNVKLETEIKVAPPVKPRKHNRP